MFFISEHQNCSKNPLHLVDVLVLVGPSTKTYENKGEKYFNYIFVYDMTTHISLFLWVGLDTSTRVRFEFEQRPALG